MSLLIRAIGPSLGFLFVHVKCEVGSFRVRHMHLIDPGKRLKNALLRQLPHVPRKGRRLIHQLPMVIENKIAKHFFALMLEIFLCIGPAAAAPKDTVNVGMLIEVLGEQFADVPLTKLATDLPVTSGTSSSWLNIAL